MDTTFNIHILPFNGYVEVILSGTSDYKFETIKLNDDTSQTTAGSSRVVGSAAYF